MKVQPFLRIILLPGILHLSTALKTNANFTELCEIVLKSMNKTEVYPNPADWNQLKCGATYSADTNYSLPIKGNLTHCLTACPGYQKSRTLSEWALSLFGFLIPALIFVLSV